MKIDVDFIYLFIYYRRYVFYKGLRNTGSSLREE